MRALLLLMSLIVAAPAFAAEDPNPVDLALAPWKGDLDGLQERRFIRILVCLNKTNYFIDRTEARGLTHDAGRAFEKFINQRLQTTQLTHIGVVFVPVARDRLIDGLIEGRGDIAAANLTITPERSARVDFSTPFMTGAREVLVTQKSHRAINSLDDLAGERIYVRASSSYFESLQALNRSFKKRGIKPVEIVSADEQLEVEDILEMVNAGVVPATIADDFLANLWVDVLDDLQTHGSIAVREGGAIAWAVRKNSPLLRAATDAFAKQNGKGTLTGNMAFKRYLQDNKWIKNATAEADMKRYRETVDFFRKYGDKYDLPWLLVAAQAYQESGIDQTKKNASGAVGVMQIKPSTAEGSPILIKGVDASAERNIEAGAKYLRFIVDQYYADQPMDNINKGLFAIASYNAGPARIAGLRKKTTQMGLNPNAWFGNVEVAAAASIGRETVEYVRNIYKYYVTYTMIAANVEQHKAAIEAAKP